MKLFGLFLSHTFALTADYLPHTVVLMAALLH